MEHTTCRVPDCTRPIAHKRNQLCGMHQARWYRHGTTDHVRKQGALKPCQVEGCEHLTRSSGATLCKKHYHRQYRHGDVDMTSTRSGISASHGRRYRNVYVPGHPVAGKRGMAYEHRVVLYEAIGPGVHQCHWCAAKVDWSANRFAANVLQVDHLNGIGDDNRPANLVPSCRACNTTRGVQHRHQALRDAGFWSENDTVARTGHGRRPLIEA